MWSGIETKRDYLNYPELAEVVSGVIFNQVSLKTRYLTCGAKMNGV